MKSLVLEGNAESLAATLQKLQNDNPTFDIKIMSTVQNIRMNALTKEPQITIVLFIIFDCEGELITDIPKIESQQKRQFKGLQGLKD